VLRREGVRGIARAQIKFGGGRTFCSDVLDELMRDAVLTASFRFMHHSKFRYSITASFLTELFTLSPKICL
jgi:hypothetical protein